MWILYIAINVKHSTERGDTDAAISTGCMTVHTDSNYNMNAMTK